MNRQLFIAALMLCLSAVGCPRHEAPQKPTIPLPVPAATQQTSQPQTLSDADIQKIISDSLNLVNLARQQTACAARQNGNMRMPGRFPPSMSQADGYSTWLNYLAAHIRSGVPFDSTYGQIAAGALDVSNWSDPTGQACLNSGTKDTDLQRAVADVDPAQIGQQLFASFLQYDQSTRDRAAKLLAGQ